MPSPLNFADVSIFLPKISVFLPAKVLLLKAVVWELCLRVFSSVSSFCKTKGYYYWKHNFCWLCVPKPVSGLLQIGQKSEKCQWRIDFPTDVIVKFFWRCFISFVKFSYWSKFHVNIITGSGIMTIFFYKGLTRNPEIRKSPVWLLPSIWKLGRVMDAKFGTNVSNIILLNAAKFQCYSFYCFWVIKGKPTGREGGGKITHPTPFPPPR